MFSKGTFLGPDRRGLPRKEIGLRTVSRTLIAHTTMYTILLGPLGTTLFTLMGLLRWNTFITLGIPQMPKQGLN